MKAPSFADVTIRTQALPLVLCSKVQTSQLLAYADSMRTVSYADLSDFELAALLLKQQGWARVEKHGNRILLIAIVTDEQITDEERRKFTRIGNDTGNWSWLDFRYAHPRRLMRTRRSY